MRVCPFQTVSVPWWCLLVEISSRSPVKHVEACRSVNHQRSRDLDRIRGQNYWRLPAKIPCSPQGFPSHRKEWWFSALSVERWLFCFRTVMPCTSEGKTLLTSQIPLCLRVSLMKLSNVRSYAILSILHLPPASLKVSSISCLKTGTYSGQVATLNIEFVINCLVVFILKAPTISCTMACKCGSFLSLASFASSRIHSIESSGFLWSWLFRTRLCRREWGRGGLSCSMVAVPDTAEFGDEKLSYRTQNRVKYSKLCRRYENGFRVLWYLH